MFTLGARARLSLGTNVNTPFFPGPTPEFGTVSLPEYKVEALYSGTKVGVYILGTQCLNTALFCAGTQALVLGHQVWTWPKCAILKSRKFPVRLPDHCLSIGEVAGRDRPLIRIFNSFWNSIFWGIFRQILGEEAQHYYSHVGDMLVYQPRFRAQDAHA